MRRGHRSFDYYISSNEGEHIKAGSGYKQLHAHMARRISCSVSKGVGPARQSYSFSLCKLCKMHCLLEPLVPMGPQHPATMG